MSCEIEQRADGQDANARAALVPRMADLTAEITDPIRRDILIADLAVRLNTGLEDLRSTVNDIIRNRKDTPPAPDYEEDYTEDEQETDTAPHKLAPARVTAVRLHPTIRNLICYSAQNKAAQQARVERIEELQDPINTLAGGLILQRLLEVLPVPGDEQAWQGFVAQLPAEQAAALRHIDNTEIELQDADAFMEQACAHAARDAVSARMDTIKTAIRNGNLSQDAIAELFREMTELQRLLNGQ